MANDLDADADDADRLNREPTPDEDCAVLRAHLAQLMEHFDSVQIIATRTDDEGTAMFDEGDGNYYARQGAVDEWLLIQRQRTRNHIRREADDD